MRKARQLSNEVSLHIDQNDHLKKSTRINSKEGVERREPSYTVGRKVSWYSQYDVLKVEPPYDPIIPLLGVYIEKAIIQKDISTLLFIAVLFTIAKI